MLAGFVQVHEGQVGAVDPDPAPPPLPGGAAEVARFFMDVPQWIQIGGLIVGGLAAIAGAILLWKHRSRAGAWLVHLPTTVKAMAVAILIGVGAVVSVAGYQVYDFVEHDNRFCTGCHVMADAFVRFEESPHAALGCKDCHAQPRTESARQLYLWVLERPEEVGPHSPVPDARCTSCHVDGDPQEWPQIAASLGHRVHFDSDDPELGELMCVTCHGVSVHEFTPVDATCGECHEAESTIRLGRMAEETELHCVACHDFLSDRPAELPGVPEGMAMLPDRPQCAACHEMGELLREGELDVDPHGAVCGACHNPHTQDTPYDAVETCMGCHEDVEEITIFHTGTHAPVMPNCTECHSAHTWEVQGSDCLSCHETILGQVDDGWNSPYTGPASTESLGEARPNGNGNGAPWALLVKNGEDAGARPSPPDTVPTPRPFLHREHEAVSCVECHGTADEHGVVTVRTARECAACHHDPARPYDCADCHGPDQLAPPREVVWPVHLTVWDEPRDRTFAFQHELHEGLECQECHTGPTLLAVEQECAACHDDHHRPEAECSQCHAPAEPGIHGLEVHLTCTSSGCHAGTAGERPALSRTLCLTCHVEQEDHEPGLSCHECHMVPLDPPLRPASPAGPAHLGAEGGA
jgi:nitrate/TMAO reductase-like tetraheme cytochrome c subunit